jgi:hypothetical protein
VHLPRSFRGRCLALLAFFLWPILATAQNPPEIGIYFGLRAPDGGRAAVQFGATSSTPVTWRVQVGPRFYDVAVNGASFMAPNFHLTFGSIGPFSLADSDAPLTLFATNAFGTSSSSGGILSVYGVAPSIETGGHPATQRATIGNDAVFRVTASGSLPLTYQWRKNGSAITGATNATYVVRNSTLADGGSYQVVVSNPYGIFTSDSATLTVTPAPPNIVSHPQSLAVNAGASAQFQVTATGAATLRYQWKKDGTNISGATQSTFSLATVQAADAGAYHVVVSNDVDTVTSSSARLTVTAAPIVFTEQPRSGTVAVGGAYTLTAVATGTAPITYQWRKDNAAIAGATLDQLALTNIQLGAAGSYSVTASNAAGSATSTSATVTVIAAPTLSQTPQPTRVLLGQAADFRAAAPGAGMTYQWRKDGADLPGATLASLTLPGTRAADAGGYSVAVTNLAGVTVSESARLDVALPGRLVNLSVLTSLQQNGDEFRLGFVLGGAATAGTKSLLVRAVGPSLAQLGVGDPLADPRMELFSGATKAGENNDWSGAGQIVDAAARLGAFPLSGASTKDAALYAAGLATGDTSAKISNNASSGGTILAEVYDATALTELAVDTPRLVNVSVLKPIGSGLTAGFVVAGDTDVTVLIRAIGPSLATFGVTDFADDPRLELRGADGLAGANQDWAGTTALTEAFGRVGAFPLNAGSKDAAMLATLAPGNYTAQVLSAGARSGTVLIEIYEVP